MNCKYIIKLPGGGKPIIIPASFGKIKMDEKLKSLLDSLKEFSARDISNYLDKPAEKSSEDVAYIVENLFSELYYGKISKEIAHQTVRAAIMSNLTTPENIVGIVDEKIQEAGDYANLEKAIRGLQTSDKDKFNSLKSELKKRVSPKYFKGVETLNIMGKTNLKTELQKLRIDIDSNDALGFDNNLNLVMKDFFNASRKLIGENAETFLPINTHINQNNTLNTQGFSFYQYNNNLSLFLAVFKRIGASLDKGALKGILQKVNDSKKLKTINFDLAAFDPDKFFNGHFEDNTFIEGDFHKLFSKKSLIPVIGEIIGLTSAFIADTNKNNKEGEYFKLMKYLFGHLDPDMYGKGFFTEQKIQEEIFNKELKQEREIKEKLLAQKTVLLLGSNPNINFSSTQKVTEDLYQTIKDKVILGQDLVKFPISGGRHAFGAVTGIYPRKNGVYIMGIRMNPDGNITKFAEPFTKSVEYRKYEGIIDSPDTLIEPKKGMLIVSDAGFSQDIIKRLVRKGDILNGKSLVIGVYAGELLIRPLSKEGRVPYPTSNFAAIKSITSQKALEDAEFVEKININEYTPIDDPQLLTSGDIFIEPTLGIRKSVLYADKTNVYSIIPTKEGSLIKGTPKSSIKSGLSHTFKEITRTEIDFVLNELTQSKSKRNSSSFVNANKSKNGDFIIYIEDDQRVIGKVVNDQVQKAVFFKNGKVTTESYENKDVTFITTRDISSDFSFMVAKANNWKVELLKDSDDYTDKVELRYVIPIDEDETSLMLLPGGYANIGRFITANYKYDQAKEKDATKQILNLMKEEGEYIPYKKLYGTIRVGTKTNANLKRNLDGLFPVYNFSKLPGDVKRELEPSVLFPGAYFSVYDGKSDIYRVINVVGNRVVVHLNSISDSGKLITIEKEFNTTELLSNDGVTNSISNLYLQYRNNKIDDLVDVVSRENVTVEDVKKSMLSSKLRNSVLRSVNKIFKGINIPVEKVNNGFDHSQLAKLQTTIDEETGEASMKMLINKKLGTAEDVIHETLHLFLIPYRYKDADGYNALLESLNDPEITNESDINNKEELFIKKISKVMISDSDLLDEYGREINPEELVTHFLRIIKSMNPEYDDLGISMVTLDILNKPLHEVLGLDEGLSPTHPMYNLGMLITEPQLRDWMKNKNITLKC